MFLVGSIGPLLPYLLILLMPLLMAGLQDFGKYETEHQNEPKVSEIKSVQSQDESRNTTHFDNHSYSAVLFNSNSQKVILAYFVLYECPQQANPYFSPARHLFRLKAPPVFLS